jgi:predicted DNA-binding transcriptional regulator AlpA
MAEMIGVGPSIFSRYTTNPRFPKPVGRKGRTLFHNPEEVTKWHAELISTRTGKAIGGMARGAQRGNEADARADEAIASGKKIDDKPSQSPRAPSSAAERAVAEIEQQDDGNPNLGDQFRGLFNR